MNNGGLDDEVLDWLTSQ